MRRPTLDRHFSDSQRHVFTDSVHVRKFLCLPTHADPVIVACSSYHDWNTLTKSRDIGDGTQSDILTIYQSNIWLISISRIVTLFGNQQLVFYHTAFKSCGHVLNLW